MSDVDTDYQRAIETDVAFKSWNDNNVAAHKIAGYAIANISLKPIDGAPGDITGEQMRQVADMADAFSFGEIRATHEQNLVLANVKKSDLQISLNQMSTLNWLIKLSKLFN